MNSTPLHILHADDDKDDCIFFATALKAIPIATHLTTVYDGEQLMNYLLAHTGHLPDVLFLDLSMPRKTGFECLTEIKANEKLKNLPVIVFSTSLPKNVIFELEMILTLSRLGAHNYIRKPVDFTQFRDVIQEAVIRLTDKKVAVRAGQGSPSA